MMFGSSPALVDAVPLGVSAQTMGIMIGTLVFARGSGLRAVIAGPGINPIVFLTEAALAIVEVVCAGGDSGAEGSGGGSGSGSDGIGSGGSGSGGIGGGSAGRRLGGSGSASFQCTNQDAVVPTVLVASAIGTLLVGTSFYCLGRFKLTEIIGYIPANVVAGFLACIGIKVLKAGIAVACPVGKKVKLEYLEYYFGSWETSWKFLVPAVPIGVLLYFLKRNHLGQPTVYFPFLILVNAAGRLDTERPRPPLTPAADGMAADGMAADGMAADGMAADASGVCLRRRRCPPLPFTSSCSSRASRATRCASSAGSFPRRRKTPFGRTLSKCTAAWLTGASSGPPFRRLCRRGRSCC